MTPKLLSTTEAAAAIQAQADKSRERYEAEQASIASERATLALKVAPVLELEARARQSATTAARIRSAIAAQTEAERIYMKAFRAAAREDSIAETILLDLQKRFPAECLAAPAIRLLSAELAGIEAEGVDLEKRIADFKKLNGIS